MKNEKIKKIFRALSGRLRKSESYKIKEEPGPYACIQCRLVLECYNEMLTHLRTSDHTACSYIVSTTCYK